MTIQTTYRSAGPTRSISEFYGEKIAEASISDEVLKLTFCSGAKISIFDDGQSCCEHRYMSTDDEVNTLVGGVLLRVEVKDGPTEDDGYHCHETQFLEVQTSRGFITIANHNEHNGYYGGFGLGFEVLAEATSKSASDEEYGDATDLPLIASVEGKNGPVCVNLNELIANADQDLKSAQELAVLPLLANVIERQRDFFTFFKDMATRH